MASAKEESLYMGWLVTYGKSNIAYNTEMDQRNGQF